jgi:hypothetical protein
VASEHSRAPGHVAGAASISRPHCVRRLEQSDGFWLELWSDGLVYPVQDATSILDRIREDRLTEAARKHTPREARRRSSASATQ